MNKPLSVATEEFKMELVGLINNSALPVCVVELVLQNYLTEIRALSQKQYQSEKAEYEKYLLNQNSIE